MSEVTIQPFSKWLLRTLVGLLCGGFGVVAKDLYDEREARLEEEAGRLTSLKHLSALLEESKSIFTSQNYQARRLYAMLRDNHPNELEERCRGKACGFDEAFFVMADLFTPEETELQSLIRSTTENSQRRVNEQMADWVRERPAFTAVGQPNQERETLAEQLRTLRLHLDQWLDKFKVWIPNEPKHSLVYLADEKNHGTGFPSGIEETLGNVISSWP